MLVLLLPITNAAAASLDAGASGVNVDLLTQSPYPARPGETVEITLSLQNEGNNDLSDVVVSLDAEYPFSQVSGESLSKTVSYMEARQDEDDATYLKFKLKVDSDVSDGTYDIDVVVKDSESDSSSVTTLEIEVQGKEYAQIVTISDSSIDVATVEPLEFVITNTGSSPLQNMAVSWEESTGTILPVYSSNTKYINSLDVGESATVVYSVMADVDADPGLYQLDITLEFEDYESDATVIETKAGLFVGGTTDFDLSYSESDAGEVSLSLANVGNNEAYSVKVSIPEQDNFQATGSTSTIVGNLEKGDYTITSFSITQTSSMPSSSGNSTAMAAPGEMSQEDMASMEEEITAKNQLLVNIEYTDSAGQRQIVEKAVQIEELTGGTTATGMGSGPGSQSSSSNSYLLYGAVALVVVVVGLNYRKKKMMKEGNYVPLNVELRNLKAKILKKE
ncbi:COG1361 S-layer family protein [Methanolobus sediminis]|uniref:COG1361 S-layer family protein n=1 Tax=Methanolobus sediminis TaxID=3072978 RepID=A0AA51UM04_9EURY|nr:COG1361 S-layer family protein [Methanolobus sediminis]WMW26063.1 COG1361 S-layer family protein [Methanolobus sediminis]